MQALRSSMLQLLDNQLLVQQLVVLNREPVEQLPALDKGLNREPVKQLPALDKGQETRFHVFKQKQPTLQGTIYQT